MNKNKLTVILFAIGLYFISAGASYLFFSGKISKVNPASSYSAPTMNANGSLSFDAKAPKTQECPLNGVLYSKQQEAWWSKHRPLGVMIENHDQARPQSGLSSADIVYEAVAEGGITRFLSVFYCQDASLVGPVRSARTYFIDWMSEYADYPLYAHVGGANQPGPADAIGQLSDYGWANYNDLNQFSFSDLTFKRIEGRLKTESGGDVATEHTMYSSTTGLWDYAASKRKLTNKDEDGNSWDKKFVKYKFTDDLSLAGRPKSQSIHLEFWESAGSDYVVDWAYDTSSNTYKRSVGGKKHLDKNNNLQLAAKNVVVLKMIESSANDGYENNLHLLYKNKGTGKAVIFKDGKKIDGTWEKQNRTARTIIKDASGQEIKFNRGQIWFEILPLEGVLTVK